MITIDQWFLGLVFALTVVLSILAATRSPHLLLRPSVWVTAVMIVRINAAAVFSGPGIDDGFAAATELRLLTVLFPVAVALLVAATPRLTGCAQELRFQLSIEGASSGDDRRRHRSAFLLLLIAGLGCLILYLRYVPLSQTGLWTIFNDPLSSKLAREESLKLLSSPAVRYTYTWYIGVISRVLVVFILVHAIRGTLRHRLGGLVGVMAIAVSAMLTGARAPGAYVLITASLGYFLFRGGVRGLFFLSTGGVAGLAVVIILTLLRQGSEVTSMVGDVSSSFFAAIGRRIFIVPFQTGVWANLYAQDTGLLGIANIRPLTLLFGEEYVNLANVTALNYSPEAIFSSSANTCFLFDFQASFGLIAGWLVSLILLLLLDSLLLVFRPLKGVTLVAFLAGFLVCLQALVASSYTTSLMTHGILPVSVLAWLMGLLLWPATRQSTLEQTDAT